MDRGHETLIDATCCLQHAGDGGQAVRGAGGVRNDVHIWRQSAVIDAIDDGGVRALAWCGNQNARRAGVEMPAGGFGIGENTGTFQHQLDAASAPVAILGTPMAHIGDTLSVDLEIAVAKLHCPVEPAMGRVQLQKKGRGFHRCQIIDGDDAVVVARRFQKRSKNVAADPAKSVDGNLLHDMSPPFMPRKYRRRGSSVN